MVATGRRPVAPPSRDGSRISHNEVIFDNAGASHSASDAHDLLLDSEDITAFLHEFTALLAERLSEDGGLTWCAVSLLRARKAGTAASSSPQAEALDELQNSFTDGPCMTAIREHTVIRVGDVREDSRWPDYHIAAAKQGVRSVLGLPFELEDDAWAGVNIYSAKPHDFGPEKIDAVQYQVDQASSALRLAVRLARHREAEKDLRAAMESRTVIDLAVGIIMGQNRCSQDDAFSVLKAASNHRNIKLRDLATDLVATTGSHSASTHFES